MMPYTIDSIANSDCTTEINGKWVIARPVVPGFTERLYHAWLVITGKADAVIYHGQ